MGAKLALAVYSGGTTDATEIATIMGEPIESVEKWLKEIEPHTSTFAFSETINKIMQLWGHDNLPPHVPAYRHTTALQKLIRQYGEDAVVEVVKEVIASRQKLSILYSRGPASLIEKNRRTGQLQFEGVIITHTQRGNNDTGSAGNNRVNNTLNRISNALSGEPTRIATVSN